MCGIAGVFAPHGQLNPALARALPRMTAAIQHRGPDGESFYEDETVALGHRRLAIIDRSGGRQPMSNEDGTVWIVFNGEVYNHHDLRRELTARGHVFKTRSDTEAIIHGYEEFGPAVVDRLEGMFAFAIYDQRAREVFIARDRLGKKPLFYAWFDGVLHFGSEMKVLRESPAWSATIDSSQLETYLSLGYLLAPRTIYREVLKLEPGHYLHVRPGGSTLRRYWDVTEFDTERAQGSALLDQLDATIGTHVEERLESEVPLGAFLSGGIDSGLIASYMKERHGRVLTTTVGFDDSRHNELHSAGATAAHLGTEHYEHLVEPALEGTLDTIVGSFDEPFADASAIPTYFVSREARRHVTVALSGDGGDEVFGGYDFRYLPHAYESRVRRRLPTLMRRAAAQAGSRWPRSARLPRAFRLGNTLENLGRDDAGAYFTDLCFLKPWDVRRLLGYDAGRDPFDSQLYSTITDTYRRCPSASPIQRAQFADLKIYLPNDPLVKVDRMSMAHSLEVRSPLLDRRLVELAFRLPESTKLPNLQAKHLLKSLAARRLPKSILELPKRGFSAPVATWMRETYADRFRDDVLSSGARVASLVDMATTRRMFAEHRAGQADHSFGLWALWILERWCRLAEAPANTGVAAA